MTRRGGITARISKADKKVPKTEIQVAICLALAEEDGVVVDPEHIYIDDGIAASGKDIDDTTLQNRPAALRCLEAMRRGEFDVLYAVEGERLARTYIDGLEWIKASAAGGVVWHLDTDGLLDPRTPAGEETAVSIFASGRREGRVRTARQKRRYDRERAAGVPLWGPRPFGYETDRVTLRADEAKLIRNAVDEVLNGGSMTRIAREWTERGILTDGMKRSRVGRDGVARPARQQWTTTAVRQLLLRDRNAGLLMHKGEPLPNSLIQPIITAEELRALKERIRSGTPVDARAKSLMGGLARCSCGAPMHMTVSYSQRKGGPRHEYMIYKCSQTGVDRTKTHTTVSQPTLDLQIPDHVFNSLRDLVSAGLAEAETPPEVIHLLSEKNALSDRRERAQQIALLPGADMSHLGRELTDIASRIDEIDAQIDAAYRDRARKGALAIATEAVSSMDLAPVWVMRADGEVAMVDPSDEAIEVEQEARASFLTHWKGLSLDEQRDLIRATIQVTITPRPDVSVSRPRVRIRYAHALRDDQTEVEPF